MKKRFIVSILIAAILMTGCAGAGSTGGAQATAESGEAAQETPEVQTAESGEATAKDTPEVEASTESGDAKGTPEVGGSEASTGDIVILYTNDVHCAIDTTIGYAGLSAYKQAMIDEGNSVFLVDDGDMIQGGIAGTVTEGEMIIDLMNAVGYDLAIPGNHEFDYGIPRFLELTQKAEFPFICCNFKDLKTGERIFDSYVIREIGGKKFGFVGVTTPQTITSSTPAFFKDESGEFVYGFCQDTSGALLYQTVQEAVDEVNEQGVDYTILVAHLGVEESASPYTSVEMIRNTTGIDIVLDGHSHTQIPMEEVKNKDGEKVILTQSGSHLEAIGKVTFDQGGNIRSELITDWEQKDPVITQDIADEMAEVKDILSEKIATSDFEFAAKENGTWLVRNNETNLGDFVADAYRYVTGAEIGFANGGSIRDNISAGDITYEKILQTAPFCGEVCCIRLKGQVISDALEYSVSFAPDMFGGFLQVSGITFDIDLDKNAQVKRDENSMFVGFESDERRVSNIMVGGEPLDPEREYTVGGLKYNLVSQGDGYTMFDGAEVVELDRYIEDVEALVEYMKTMNGTVSEDYADRFGQERIHFLNE